MVDNMEIQNIHFQLLVQQENFQMVQQKRGLKVVLMIDIILSLKVFVNTSFKRFFKILTTFIRNSYGTNV